MKTGQKVLSIFTICALFGINLYFMYGNVLRFFPSAEKSYISHSINDKISQTSPTFVDDAFAPLMELFRRKALNTLLPQLTRFRSGSIPRVLVWAKPLEKKFWRAVFRHVTEGYCPLPCEIIYDVEKRNTSDAIIINTTGAKDFQTVTESLSPRDPHQPWVMHSFESPPSSHNRYRTPYANYNGLFNRTMTYRRDSDVVVNHGFVVTKEDAPFLPKPWVVPPVTKLEIPRERKLAVAFISNCRAASNRLQYIKGVQKYAPVDVYGRCGRLKCSRSMYIAQRYNATTHRCLKMAGETYLFYFAFESNLCKEYVTEKLYNVLYYPIVPVVRGSANYASILPPNSYINADDYSPKELAERLVYLKDHPEEYEKLLEWKRYYQPSTVSGDRIVCQMCSRLYDPEFYKYKVYEDFEDWFVLKANCMILMSF